MWVVKPYVAGRLTPDDHVLPGQFDPAPAVRSWSQDDQMRNAGALPLRHGMPPLLLLIMTEQWPKPLDTFLLS